MAKMTIIEGNSNDKDNVRAYMVKGERGYSAYEIAVQQGYTGTEEEWKDSFINADTYYNKTETDNLYVANSNIVKVTGTISSIGYNEHKYVKLDYPENFNLNNCIILSGRVREKFSDSYGYGNWHSTNFFLVDTSDVSVITFRDFISIESDGIYYSYYNDVNGFIVYEIEVELYLMKISSEVSPSV